MTKRYRVRNRVLAGTAALAIGIMFFAFFVGLGRWFQFSEPPRPADMIVVLAGGYDRSIMAAQLYAQGFAPEIWISRPVREPSLARLDRIGISLPAEEELHRQVLMKSGVPDSRIHFYGRDVLSTVEEALSLREALGNRRVTILLVSQRTHLRRARMIFQDTFPADRIVAVASDAEGPKTIWWTDKDLSTLIINELIRTVYYEAGGRFLTHPH